MAKTRRIRRGKSRKMRHLRRAHRGGNKFTMRSLMKKHDISPCGSVNRPFNTFTPNGVGYCLENENKNNNNSSVVTGDPINNTTQSIPRNAFIVNQAKVNNKAPVTMPAVPKPSLFQRARNATRRAFGRMGTYISDEIATAQFRRKAKAQQNKNRKAKEQANERKWQEKMRREYEEEMRAREDKSSQPPRTPGLTPGAKLYQGTQAVQSAVELGKNSSGLFSLGF